MIEPLMILLAAGAVTSGVAAPVALPLVPVFAAAIWFMAGASG